MSLMLRYLSATLVLAVALWLLREVVAMELVFSVLFAITVGLLASDSGRHDHVRGMVLIQVGLAIACAFAASTTESPYGSFLGARPQSPYIQAMAMYGSPPQPSIFDRMTLAGGMVAILILAAVIMLSNKVAHGRFLIGGILSGIAAGGFSFILLSLIVMLIVAGRGVMGYERWMGIFYLSQFKLPAVIFSFIGLYFLVTVAMIWRGLTMPRFLRAPRPLPAYSARRGTTLIELLIVIAIIAIVAAPFGYVIHTAALHNRKAEEARLAVRIARNEFEAMRATGAPGPGILPPKPSRLPTHIVVRGAGADGLAPVSVEVIIGAPLQTETVRFEALIPATREAGS